jgi:hypothetical protein
MMMSPRHTYSRGPYLKRLLELTLSPTTVLRNIAYTDLSALCEPPPTADMRTLQLDAVEVTLAHDRGAGALYLALYLKQHLMFDFPTQEQMAAKAKAGSAASHIPLPLRGGGQGGGAPGGAGGGGSNVSGHHAHLDTDHMAMAAANLDLGMDCLPSTDVCPQLFACLNCCLPSTAVCPQLLSACLDSCVPVSS